MAFIVPAVGGLIAALAWFFVAQRLTECHYPLFKRIGAYFFMAAIALVSCTEIVRGERIESEAELIWTFTAKCFLVVGLFIAGLWVERKIPRICDVPPIKLHVPLRAAR